MRPIKVLSVNAGINRNPDVAFFYGNLEKGEGYSKIPENTETVKIVKVFKSYHSNNGRTGNIQLVSDKGDLILGIGSENRVDEIGSVIWRKGFAEIQFSFERYDRNRFAVYNIGKLGKILNA